jgi:hypothetical protein
MSKSKLEKAGGCLIRAGGILGALSVAGVLSLFALCGYLHLRHTLAARHGGKLLVRVREPLLATDPPLPIPVPSFVSARQAPWAIIVQSEHGEVSLIKATPEHYRPVGLLNVPDGSRRVVPRPAWTAPALAGQRLYICGDRELACFELAYE